MRHDCALCARWKFTWRRWLGERRQRVGSGAVLWGLAVALTLSASGPAAWPGPLASRAPLTGDDALVQGQRVCVLEPRETAGEIGKTLVVRQRREGQDLWVSYFVYWSSERPWGHKPFWMSLAIDAFYSHFLFVLPGLRHALYGPGDIEGVTVRYRDVGDRLQIIEAYGDNEWHHGVRLGPEDLTGANRETVLMTTVWSHQLGGRGAARVPAEAPGVARHCFEGQRLVPLTDQIAERFRLGSPAEPLRARFAWL